MKRKKPELIETKELCKYGCGNIAKYKTPGGHLICDSSYNKCPINRAKNTNGLKQAHKDGKLNCDHFDGKRDWAKGKTAETNESIRKHRDKMKSLYASGELKGSFTGKHHTNKVKQKISNSMQECSNGHIRTKWYEVNCPYENKLVKVQGTWELAYAKYLNEQNISWKRCNKLFINYKLSPNSYIKKYIPDFYLIDTDEYIEIKGYWWKSDDGRVDDRRKMKCVIDQNPSIKIIILEKQQMKDLNLI